MFYQILGPTLPFLVKASAALVLLYALRFAWDKLCNFLKLGCVAIVLSNSCVLAQDATPTPAPRQVEIVTSDVVAQLQSDVTAAREFICFLSGFLCTAFVLKFAYV